MRSTKWFLGLTLTSALVAAGCASNGNVNTGSSKMSQAKLAEPEVEIRQISNVASAARNVTGPLSVQYQMRVINHADQPITLNRVNITTQGGGSYRVLSQSVPFKNVTIPPGGAETVEFWVNAFVPEDVGPSVVGANGPVTVRGIADFGSGAGSFQHTWIQQVSGNMM
jgi:outer membrane murein-binding lipoprotein Lpp